MIALEHVSIVFSGYVSSNNFILLVFFFFKQKTAYEMRISDWSSDVCSSDLLAADARAGRRIVIALRERRTARVGDRAAGRFGLRALRRRIPVARPFPDIRSEEHTSELQSLMRIS